MQFMYTKINSERCSNLMIKPNKYEGSNMKIFLTIRETHA